MDIVKHSSTAVSPFDNLMGDDGKWSARDLQKATGYVKWQNFEPAILAARRSIEVNDGVSAGRAMVTESSKHVARGFGRPQEIDDYRLTRYGAYRVLMELDGTKPEVAAAKHYFAVKTREAETAPQVDVAKLTRRDLAMMVIEAEDRLEAAESRNLELEAANARIAPLAQAHEDWQTAQGAYPMDTAAHMLGTGRNRLYSKLRDIGVLKRLKSEPIGTEIHNGHVPYQQYMDRGYFFTVAARHYVPETGITKVSHKVHITPKGLEWLKGKLV